MKKYFFILLIVFLVVVIFFTQQQKSKEIKGFRTTNYKLLTKTYKLLIADTPEKWEKGLMFFRKPVNFDGMMFQFPDKQIQTFWNKNTFMDLDLYWMDADKIVGKSFLPSIEKSKKIVSVNSPTAADRVIELIR
jgi:hypothetical protein